MTPGCPTVVGPPGRLRSHRIEHDVAADFEQITLFMNHDGNCRIPRERVLSRVSITR